MEPSIYHTEALLERTHWWFVARRKLFKRVVREQTRSYEEEILDIGTSTGGNLAMLHELGYRNAAGIDRSPEAVRYCRDRGLSLVRQGDACALPFEDESFRLVLATDILEHVEDDLAALREIGRVLRPGCAALITVPAYEILWSRFDDLARHKRRYRIRDLRERLLATGLEIVDSYYFNYLLWPWILGARLVMRQLGIEVENENTLTRGWANRVLELIFSIDVATARFVRPPFGVSILAVVRKAG